MNREEINKFWIGYFEADHFRQKEILKDLLKPLMDCVFNLESRQAIEFIILSTFQNYIHDVSCVSAGEIWEELRG